MCLLADLKLGYGGFTLTCQDQELHTGKHVDMRCCLSNHKLKHVDLWKYISPGVLIDHHDDSELKPHHVGIETHQCPLTLAG